MLQVGQVLIDSWHRGDGRWTGSFESDSGYHWSDSSFAIHFAAGGHRKLGYPCSDVGRNELFRSEKRGCKCAYCCRLGFGNQITGGYLCNLMRPGVGFGVCPCTDVGGFERQ